MSKCRRCLFNAKTTEIDYMESAQLQRVVGKILDVCTRCGSSRVNSRFEYNLAFVPKSLEVDMDRIRHNHDEYIVDDGSKYTNAKFDDYEECVSIDHEIYKRCSFCGKFLGTVIRHYTKESPCEEMRNATQRHRNDIVRGLHSNDINICPNTGERFVIQEATWYNDGILISYPAKIVRYICSSCGMIIPIPKNYWK